MGKQWKQTRLKSNWLLFDKQLWWSALWKGMVFSSRGKSELTEKKGINYVCRSYGHYRLIERQIAVYNQ